jgi:hypothetical protein
MTTAEPPRLPTKQSNTTRPIPAIVSMANPPLPGQSQAAAPAASKSTSARSAGTASASDSSLITKSNSSWRVPQAYRTRQSLSPPRRHQLFGRTSSRGLAPAVPVGHPSILRHFSATSTVASRPH